MSSLSIPMPAQVLGPIAPLSAGAGLTPPQPAPAPQLSPASDRAKTDIPATADTRGPAAPTIQVLSSAGEVVQPMKSLKKLSKIEPVCSLVLPETVKRFLRAEIPVEALGPVAGPCCKELAARHNVPVAVPVLAALTVAGAVCGKRACLDAGLGAPAPASFVAIIAGAEGSGVAAAVESLMEPVFKLQGDLVQDAENSDEADVAEQAQTWKMRRLYAAIQSARHSSGGSYLSECKRMLAAIRPVTHPAIVAPDLARQSLVKALPHSLDGTLFHGATNVQGILKGADYDLVASCLSRLPTQLDGVSVPGCCIRAGLSILMTTSAANLNAFLAECQNLPASLRRAMVAFDSGAGPAKMDPDTKESCHAEDWHQRLWFILRQRCFIDEIYLTASPEARAHLAGFHNGIVDLAPQVPVQLHEQLLALPGLAVRLAAALQVLQPQLMVPVSGPTAAAAVNLAKFYGGHQLGAWVETKAAATQYEFHSEIELMLSRIRVRGPITRRSLYRSYHKQATAVHETTLCQLLSQGLIVQDCQGRLAINPAIEQVPLTS